MGTDAWDGKQAAPPRRARRWLRWLMAAPLLFAAASVEAALQASAESHARAVAEKLDYVGVFALELFVRPLVTADWAISRR